MKLRYFVRLAFHRSLLLLCSLLSGSPAFAGSIDALRTFITQVHSARGQFVQRQMRTHTQIHTQTPANAANLPTASRSTENTSTGTFVFARPGKFIWTYQKPYQQVLQADGKTFYIYDQDLNQVTQRKLENALDDSSAAILFGGNHLTQNFNLRDAGTNQGVDWVELTPKAQDSQFQRIIIGFRDNNLEAMELDDAFGNITLLTFTHIEKNLSLPIGQFKFKVPKGADVIDG